MSHVNLTATQVLAFLEQFSAQKDYNTDEHIECFNIYIRRGFIQTSPHSFAYGFHPQESPVHADYKDLLSQMERKIVDCSKLTITKISRRFIGSEFFCKFNDDAWRWVPGREIPTTPMTQEADREWLSVQPGSI